MKIEKVTIAHISDLHRSQDNPISNTALLNSLLHDSDNYSAEGISTPDLLILSGDVVQGHSSESILIQQYDEALGFLSEFADRFFDGDRSRVILIPGNHDISWQESQKSMEKIKEKEVTEEDGNLSRKILSEAIKIDTNIKWSWPDRSFYRITDKEAYNNRLACFSDMYQKFYNGERAYSLDPDDQFEFFDYQKYGVTIVGFNSCFHNDHLNRAGSINPRCIAEAGLKIRELKNQGRLIFATWHHNTKGGPYDQDYMDDTFLKSLISYGVKIGFHGHQHRNEVLREESNIIDGEMMLILSAGSICAGPAELPTGYNQQYNLLELSRKSNELVQFKLFSRLKTPESLFDNPVWGKGLFNSTSTEFTTEIKHPTPPILDLGKAEKLLGEALYREAADILEQHDMKDPIVRQFLLECYGQLEDYPAIIEHYSDPKTRTECIGLINAGIEAGSNKDIEQILSLACIEESADPSVVHLRDQLKGKMK